MELLLNEQNKGFGMKVSGTVVHARLWVQFTAPPPAPTTINK
jgi:hypothetical protein